MNIIHLMYGPEGNSFVFPRVLMFPETKCFVIYLDFHTAKTKKQRRREGNNCAIVSRSGYIEFGQGHVTKNQTITVLIWSGESLAI